MRGTPFRTTISPVSPQRHVTLVRKYPNAIFYIVKIPSGDRKGEPLQHEHSDTKDFPQYGNYLTVIAAGHCYVCDGVVQRLPSC